MSALFVLIYLAGVGRKRWRLGAFIAILVLVAGAYVLLTYSQTGAAPFQEQYLTLMALHLPLLAWAGVGGYLIARHRGPVHRFSFLIKSDDKTSYFALGHSVSARSTGIPVPRFGVPQVISAPLSSK